MRLFSKKIGDKGDNLIIIHGLFGMSDNWRSLGKKFSNQFRVHIIDLRNHGRSPHDDEFNYNVMCEDVLNYIDANNIDKPIILGHSLGGKVAMKFAFTYAERIAKLIVADIAPRRYNTDFHENLLLNISRINLRNFNTRNDVEKELSLVINNSDVRLFLLKNLYRNENMELGWRFNIKILLSKVRNIQDDSFVRGVCNVPTHFIRGGNSDYINPSDEIIIKNHFSNYSILTIKDSGHWLHAEQPDIFFNEVTSCCLR